MSLIGAEPVGLIDPTLRNDPPPKYGVVLGGTSVDWRQYNSTSYSNTNITWTTSPPTENTYVDPRIFMNWTVQLTFTGTSASGPLLQLGSSDGPRAWPIMNAINTGSLVMNINTGSIQQQFDVQHAMMRFGNWRDERQLRISTTPTMMDQYQNYGDWVTYGSARNPLALYGENLYEQTRGGFYGITVNSNPSGGGTLTAVVTLQCFEPLWFSPLSQWQQTRGFAGITTWQWNVQVMNFARMWSHDAINGNPISNIVGTFAAAPQICFRYLVSKFPVPRGLYPFNDVTARYVTAGISLSGGASTTIPSITPSIDVIPRIIYIFARPTNSQYFVGSTSANVSDCYARINSIVLQWGSAPGYFANAQPVDLYNMSVDNGLVMNWTQWNRHIGSVLAIRPGKDFPLEPGQASGMQNRTTFSCTVNITNVGTQTYTYDLYIVPVTAGAMEIEGSNMKRTDVAITQDDVRRAEAGPVIPMDTHEKLGGAGLGAGMLDTLKAVFNDYGKPALGFLKRGLAGTPYAPVVNAVSSMFGAGAMVPYRGSGFKKPESGGGFIDDSKESQYQGQGKRLRLMPPERKPTHLLELP